MSKNNRNQPPAKPQTSPPQTGPAAPVAASTPPETASAAPSPDPTAAGESAPPDPTPAEPPPRTAADDLRDMRQEAAAARAANAEEIAAQLWDDSIYPQLLTAAQERDLDSILWLPSQIIPKDLKDAILKVCEVHGCRAHWNQLGGLLVSFGE